MTSPFPGMDPFLEEPTEWGGVHTRLVNAISDYLAGLISPNFFVGIEQRDYLITPEEAIRYSIAPDVYVVSEAITTPTLIEPIYDLEIHDRYLEIRDTANCEVVTTIEVLSPFNKAPNTSGRQAFLRKRQTVMASKVHWLEIDLLRPANVRQKLPVRVTITPC